MGLIDPVRPIALSAHMFATNRKGGVTETAKGTRLKESLADAFPEIAAQWHPELNDRGPDDVGPGSGFVAAWKGCSVNPRHVWRTAVRMRTRRGAGCAVCAGKQITPGVTDLATVRPDLAAQWHPTLNDRGPEEVSPGSHYLATWHNCPIDPRHIWQSQVNSRTKPTRPYGCSICSGKQVMPGISDLATTHPSLAAQWHPTLNDRTPQQVGAGSSYKAYWSGCTLNPGHIWRTAVGNRTLHGTGCAVCAGQVVQVGFNDLATKHSALTAQWHPTKNQKGPTAYTATSGFRPWWVCSKGHEWRASIASRSSGVRSGCPDCSMGSTSRPEITIRNTLKVSDAIEVLSDRPVALDVPWSNRKRISVDVLGQRNGQLIVVEYDGSYYHSSDTALAKDQAKTMALLTAGYVVIRLRENKLPPLRMEHPRLLQANFPYRDGLCEASASKRLKPILKWIQNSI